MFIIAVLHRSASQSHNTFTNFTTSLELTLQAISSKNPFLSLILGDFNAKNKVWFDRDNTTTKGAVINDPMTQYGLAQIIHEPAFDLILTTKHYYLMKHFCISWAVLFQIRRWILITGSLLGLIEK